MSKLKEADFYYGAVLSTLINQGIHVGDFLRRSVMGKDIQRCCRKFSFEKWFELRKNLVKNIC